MRCDAQGQLNRTFSEFYLWLATEAPADCPTQLDAYNVYAFDQMWSNTACGFGGLAGNAITDAMTVVFRRGNFAAVFINARFAYYIWNVNEVENFLDDLRDHKMAGAADKGRNYVTRYTKKVEVV